MYNEGAPAVVEHPGARQPMEVVAMASIQRLCSVSGCKRKHYSLGFCRTHYLRQNRLGTTELPRAKRETLTCSVEGCGRPFRAKGLCRTHYERTAQGKPLHLPKDDGDEGRFWTFVLKTPECWLWQGGSAEKGYGVFSVDGRSVGAHRFSYSLVHGPIPDGLFVLHRCDNPPCVNPDHLFLGTAKDNLDDMMSKGRGRWSFGESRPEAKLTESDVKEIRRLYATGLYTWESLAKTYSVSAPTIGTVVRRTSWKHI